MNNSLRIFYVGSLADGTTTLDRMLTLRELGVEVIPFDTTRFLSGGNRIIRSIESRLNFGPNVWRVNKHLISAARRQTGISHIWIDKGVWLKPATLLELRRVTGGVLVHFTPDPAILYHKSPYFTTCIPLYDILFTTKQFEVDIYKNAGAKRVVLTSQAYEKRRFFPRTPSAAELSVFRADVSLIAHFERHYADRLLAAARFGGRVRVWGPGWSRARWRIPQLRQFYSGDGLWGQSYPIALSCAKVCLGLLTKFVPETTTTRTFEIPACAVFMLAERTTEHMELFEEGKEAEFFDCDDELGDKIRYYLAHEQQRESIALAGRIRCLKNGYSNHERLREILCKIQKFE